MFNLTMSLFITCVLGWAISYCACIMDDKYSRLMVWATVAVFISYVVWLITYCLT